MPPEHARVHVRPSPRPVGAAGRHREASARSGGPGHPPRCAVSREPPALARLGLRWHASQAPRGVGGAASPVQLRAQAAVATQHACAAPSRGAQAALDRAQIIDRRIVRESQIFEILVAYYYARFACSLFEGCDEHTQGPVRFQLTARRHIPGPCESDGRLARRGGVRVRAIWRRMCKTQKRAHVRNANVTQTRGRESSPSRRATP